MLKLSNLQVCVALGHGCRSGVSGLDEFTGEDGYLVVFGTDVVAGDSVVVGQTILAALEVGPVGVVIQSASLHAALISCNMFGRFVVSISKKEVFENPSPML